MKLLFPDASYIDRYLHRIGITESVTCDLEGLNRLLQAQLYHVPFENIDIWNEGICPSLEIQDLFRKIVERNRGGYCFELNTLFRVLLNSLGFDAYQVIASLVNVDGIAAPPAHNGIICCLNGKKYFLDVGYGGPVPMQAMELTQVPQHGFRLVQKEDFYYLNRLEDGLEYYSLRFRDAAVEPCELVPLNFYISQLPDVHFRNRLTVNQRKEDGRIYALSDHTLKIHSPAGVAEFTLRGKDVLLALLREDFGMDITGLKLRKKF